MMTAATAAAAAGGENIAEYRYTQHQFSEYCVQQSPPGSTQSAAYSVQQKDWMLMASLIYFTGTVIYTIGRVGRRFKDKLA